MGSTKSGSAGQGAGAVKTGAVPRMPPLSTYVDVGPQAPTIAPVLHSDYAPLQRNGRLPPAVTTQLVTLVYRHAHLWPGRILSAAGLASGQEPDEQFRKHLDDPHFRERLAKFSVPNPRGKLVQLEFHQRLYDYLRDVRCGKRGLYEDVIKRSLRYDKRRNAWFLDAEKFRNSVAALARRQGAASVQPKSQDETLALFVVAFGQLQPDDAASFVQALLPLGSGLAEFFGIHSQPQPPHSSQGLGYVSPAPVVPSAAETPAAIHVPAPPRATSPSVARAESKAPLPSTVAPAAPPRVDTASAGKSSADARPSPEVSFTVVPSSPVAPTSEASSPLLGAPASAGAERPAELPPSPIVAPSETYTEPSPHLALLKSSPGSTSPPLLGDSALTGMSATDSDPAENEHWQVIDACAAQLLTTYEELRKYSEQFRHLREQEDHQYQVMDELGLAETQARIKNLIPLRRAAEKQVETACDGLDLQIKRLHTALEKEGTEPVSKLLGDLQELITRARSSPSAEVAQQLKDCATQVRTHLRDARTQELGDLEQRIEEVCDQLDAFGEPTGETRSMLAAKRYLDWPIERARLRLENELDELRARLAATEREQACGALLRLEQQLALTAPASSLEELQALTRLLEQAVLGEEPNRLAKAGKDVAERIASASIPFTTALSLWRRSVCCFWGEGTSAARLTTVAPLLPRVPPGIGSDELAHQVKLLLIDAHHTGDEAAELWRVLDLLLEGGQLAWAQAFFSVLWQDAPPPQTQARWWLKTRGQGLDEVRLEEFVDLLRPIEAYAVRRWAAEQGTAPIRSIPHPLLAPWLLQRRPFPSVESTQRAIETAAAGREPASSALLGALVALTGQQLFRMSDVLKHLRVEGFPTIAAHLEVFSHHTRDDLARQLERHRNQLHARRELEKIEERNPGGHPAYQAWKRIVSRLNALRTRLRQPAQREAALAELAAIKPVGWLEQALEEVHKPGLNPKATEVIPQWIAEHQRHLPAATEPPVDIPEGFLSPPSGALQRELEALQQQGGLGTLAAGYLLRLLNSPTQIVAPEDGPDFEAEVRKLFHEALSRPLLCWRFQLSRIGDGAVAAGEDVLEDMAQLCAPHSVVLQYLGSHRLDLAEALRDSLQGSERELVAAEVHMASERAREEQKAFVQSLVLEPLEQALKAGAQDEVVLGQHLTDIQKEATGLLGEMPGLTVSEAEARANALLTEASATIKRWEQLDKQRRQDLYEHFLKAIQSFKEGRPIEDGPLLVQMLGAALTGDLSEARRYLSLRALPPDHPGRTALPPRPAPPPHHASRPHRIRAAAPVEMSALSRFTRQAWERTELPHGFQLPSTHATGLLPVHEQQLTLLRTAKRLHADGQPWRPRLARWALEEGFHQVRERGFSRASEYARDSALLLAAEPCLEEARWYLDEALTLWLGARLEGSDLARAREPLPWDDLRNHLRVAFLVRRFVEYRGLDVLAEIAIELAAIGGLAPSRLLCTIGENEYHLRGLLVREVIRNGANLDSVRLTLITDLLGPLSDPDAAARLEQHLGQWTGSATQSTSEEWMRELSRQLTAAGIPAELRNRVEESFLQRHTAQRAQPSDTRFSVSMATTFVYLSSAKESEDGIQLVANVNYREGLGNVLDLKLAATLDHPTLTLESANKIQEVGLLRPGDLKDIVFPLVTAPGSERGGEAAKAQVTLLLYREDARGQTEQLSRRKFTVNVAAHYPHQDEPTPYITGKCVSVRSMIKGRDKEVAEILGKLRGQHGENFVLIYGMRRIGKSSLLQRLSLDNRFRKHYEMVHLDLERHLKEQDTPQTLLEKLAAHIREELSPPAARLIEPQLQGSPDCYDAFEKYLRRVAEALGDGKRLLLLFDEFQMLFAARGTHPSFTDLVKTLRHWIQFLPVGFVVAGTPELKKATLGPEQRLFQLGLPVELKALDIQAARELIQEPIAKYFHITGAATDHILEETDRLPNLIQIICHHLFLRMLRRQQTVATQRDVREVVRMVSRNAEHFSFLLNPAGNSPLHRAVIRALAELGVDEKRGTVDELLEHLYSHGYDRTVTPEALEQSLTWLSEHDLTINWKGELRLRPALLARHVLQRQEYEL